METKNNTAYYFHSPHFLSTCCMLACQEGAHSMTKWRSTKGNVSIKTQGRINGTYPRGKEI